MDPRTPPGEAPAAVERLRQALRLRAEGTLVLPLLSETKSRVLSTCADDEADLDGLATCVTHDPSLAVHVLRVANSVHYAPLEPIVSLPQAITRLGIATLRDITVAVALKEGVFRVPGFEDRLHDLWRHSISAACYAREAARLLQRDVEPSFLLGLLHDVGMPLAMQLVCDMAGARVLPRIMETLLDDVHCELGARLALRWNLGERIAAVIRHHHELAHETALACDVDLVAFADALASWALEDGRNQATTARIKALADGMHLQAGTLRALLEMRESIRRAAQAFV